MLFRSTDKDGGTDSKTFKVAVNNVAPTVTAPANQSANEGASTSFTLGSFSDPGVNDTPWTVDVDWGDGSPHTAFSAATQGALGMKSHTYADNTTPPATGYTVTDKDGDAGSASFHVAVANVAPTATLGNNGPVNEGSAATISFSAPFDPSGADTLAGFHYAFDCAGGALSATYATAGTSGSTSCTYADGPSTHTVSGRILDKDGGFTDYTTSVTVNNAAPVVTAPADQSANEGASTSFPLGSFSDAGVNDTPWAVDGGWGDGSVHTTFAAA